MKHVKQVTSSQQAKQTFIAALAVAALLTACGGGGGGGEQGGPTSPPAQASYRSAKQTVKDFESNYVAWRYSVAGQPDASGVSWGSVVTTHIDADGGYARAEVDQDGENRTYTQYTVDGARKSVGEPCGYVFTPAFSEIPATLTLGQSWETSTIRTCTNDADEHTAVTAKGSVVAVEPLTVRAGTFTAVKTVTAVTYKFPRSTTVSNQTCWRDTVTGVELKCDIVGTTTPVDPAKPVRTRSFNSELAGYAQAATGRQKLNVERFTGVWQVWFTGTAEGICSVRIASNGVVNGRCNNNYNIVFDIAGTVDAQGVASFSLVGNGISGPGFTGSFESPLKIAGTWAAGDDKGTWYMLHM